MEVTGQVTESLSAYDFQRRNVAASSSSEQTTVSPGTSVRAVKPQPAPKLRPPYISFASSEGDSSQRIWISSDGKLLEEVDWEHNRAAIDRYKHNLSQEQVKSSFVEASSAAVHGFKKDVTESPKLSSLRSLKFSPEPVSLISTIAPKERLKWTRSQSGSIWIRKHRAARETSSSDDSAPRASAGIIIMPLIPPAPPSASELNTSKTSSVRVETPFPDVQEVPKPAIKVLDMHSTDSLAQNIPLATQRVLSAPFVALRRFVKMKPADSNPHASHDQDASQSPIELQGHKSNLRRHQTTQMLNRVSSLLLEGSKIPKFGRKFGVNASDLPRSHHEGQGKSRTATFNVSKNKSIEDFVTPGTATSSIIKMQMGTTPLNSVLDTATYKVKRSPSQETEEFFAIDISIRGGTSYLPSEARRIHTPPLPDDDVINCIHKQGHFFDYYPSNSTKVGNKSSQHHNSQTFVSGRRASQLIIEKPEPFTSTTSLSLQNPTSKRSLSLSQTKPYDSPSQDASTMKEKNGDWLETPNADLHSLIANNTEVSSSQPPTSLPTPLEEPRSEHFRIKTMSVREHQQCLDQLDWTIPEHLPSSPLCPRHPRY